MTLRRRQTQENKFVSASTDHVHVAIQSCASYKYTQGRRKRATAPQKRATPGTPQRLLKENMSELLASEFDIFCLPMDEHDDDLEDFETKIDH